MLLNIKPAPAPTLLNLSATPVLGAVNLKWDVSSDPTYKATQVWRATSADVTKATMIAVVAGNTYTDNITTTQYYWVKSTNKYDRSDGAFSNGVSSTGRLITGTDIGPGAVNLATHVTGALAAGSVTGLGALALLDQVGVAKVTGLGSLATQNSVNGATQVTNLGNLAYANSIAANQIGAGTLAAGVVYAGTINASNITSGTMSADRLNGGTITGTTININGNFRVGSDGMTQLYTANLTRCTTSNSDAPGIASLTCTAYGSNSMSNGPALQVNGGGYGNAITITGGNNGIVQNGGGTNWLKTTVANAQNAFDLGSTDYSWRNVYSYGGYVTVSDKRLKDDIKDSELGLEFIKALRPVSYKMAVGHNQVIDHELQGPGANGAPLPIEQEIIPVPGTRRHYGLLAQEVHSAMQAHGVEDAAFWIMADPSNPDSQQGLRYEELISPLIRAVQELSALVDAQDQRIKVLENKTQQGH